MKGKETKRWKERKWKKKSKMIPVDEVVLFPVANKLLFDFIQQLHGIGKAFVDNEKWLSKLLIYDYALILLLWREEREKGRRKKERRGKERNEEMRRKKKEKRRED